MTEETIRSTPEGIVFAPLPKNKKFVDLTGRRFKEWTVLGYAKKMVYPLGGSQQFWWCQCSCGTVKMVCGGGLTIGSRGSCGCLGLRLSKERSTKHGMSKTPEYRAWCKMIARCYNRNDAKYHRYGARGISVCDEWIGEGGFVRFLDCVKTKPAGKYSLGRIDNDGNYKPGNVRWETDDQQANNRSSNVLLIDNGDRLTGAQCARVHGLNATTLHHRIKQGFSDATSSVDFRSSDHTRIVTCDGKSQSILDWSRQLSVSPRILSARKNRGWTDDDIIKIPSKKRRSNRPKPPSQTACTDQQPSPSHQCCHESKHA